MRLLHFEPDSKRYDLCYQALLFSKAPLQRNELKAHGALLTKLEEIGQCANPARGRNDVALYDSVTGGDVLVEEREFEILVRLLDGTIAETHKAFTRELDQTLDWLAGVQPWVNPAPVARAAPPAVDQRMPFIVPDGDDLPEDAMWPKNVAGEVKRDG
jgi:hypothetical protein